MKDVGLPIEIYNFCVNNRINYWFDGKNFVFDGRIKYSEKACQDHSDLVIQCLMDACLGGMNGKFR